MKQPRLLYSSILRPQIRALLLSSWSFFEIAICSAQDFTDEVTLKTAPGNGRLTVPGEIVDYTGKQLTLRTGKSRKETTYQATDVIDVRTTQLPDHSQGLKLLGEGRTADAEALFEKAHSLEPRIWMRRELLALLMQCALRRNDWSLAGSRYLRLHQADPDTRHINLIPLVWDNSGLDVSARVAATGWLKDPNPVAKLLGASALLFDARSTASCETILRELVRQPGERVRTLAQWQLWRLRVYSDRSEITDNELKHWTETISKLEPALKPGAYYVLAQGHLQRQEFDLAAATFLRIAFGHPSDHPLTSQSLLGAVIALRKTGQHTQSSQLLDELIAKHRHTNAAREAQWLIKE